MLRPLSGLACLAMAIAISGCAVAGAGAGIIPGTSTQTNGQNQTGDKDKAPEGQNNLSANKAAVSVVTSTDSMILLPKRTENVAATVTYVDGTKDGNVAWSSTDSTIVSVNPTTGAISGVKPGTATIQAKSASDPTKFANVTITVKEGEVQALFAEVSPASATLGINETVQLDATITRSNTKVSPNGSWSSSNQQIAFVGDDGLVTGRKAGKATITFTADDDPTVKAKSTITVSGGTDDTAAE